MIWSYHICTVGVVDVDLTMNNISVNHDDIIKWKHFPRYWPFVWGIHRSSVNSPHKGQWCGALMFSFIYAWINTRVNNREAGDLRLYRDHYGVTVMWTAPRTQKSNLRASITVHILHGVTPWSVKMWTVQPKEVECDDEATMCITFDCRSLFIRTLAVLVLTLLHGWLANAKPLI